MVLPVITTGARVVVGGMAKGTRVVVKGTQTSVKIAARKRDRARGVHSSSSKVGRKRGGLAILRNFKRAKRIRKINEEGREELLSKSILRNPKLRILRKVKIKVVGGLFKRGKAFVLSVMIFSWVIWLWLVVQLPFYAFSILALALDSADIFGLFGVVSETLYLFTALVIMTIGWGSLLVASIQYKLGGIHCFFGKNSAGKIFLFVIAAAAYGPWPGNFAPWILLWMIYVAYHPE